VKKKKILLKENPKMIPNLDTKEMIVAIGILDEEVIAQTDDETEVQIVDAIEVHHLIEDVTGIEVETVTVTETGTGIVDEVVAVIKM
jgi:hypothetical protein